MSFTQDKYDVVTSEKTLSDKGREDKLTISEEGFSINEANPFAQYDYNIIIQTFEKEAANWAEEDYAIAYHYKDVYSTKNFSERVKQQLNYYPGMHQTASVPSEDPAYTESTKAAKERTGYWNNAMENPDAFMNGLRQRQQDFDYTKIFGSDTSAQARAQNVGKLLTQCVPCFGRVLDLNSLLPDGDLLEVHMTNTKIRTDMLDKLKTLLHDPGYYIDICEILNMFSKICPQDLLAMLALLTQYVAKLNLDIKFNIDFIMQLIGPLLSPFLDSLTQWLDKWIQMILQPMICVVDHINETIAIAQNSKIPLSEASATIDFDIGKADYGHEDSSAEFSLGTVMGEGAWAKGELERFNTPQEEKYNPNKPDWPQEEIDLAGEEMSEALNPSWSEAEREEKNKQWKDLKDKQRNKERAVPPPERYPNRDGTRWSKDNIPNSEKQNFQFGSEYYPPEKQDAPGGPRKATEYFDPTPIVSSVVQIRNILVGSIEYVKDWFTYATQMIYDLLGTDYGWMVKKIDSSMLKSRLIQLIFIIKSIIEAISKNGLQCGAETNFDNDQVRHILEDGLNKFSSTKFKVAKDGSITIKLPGSTDVPDIKDLSENIKTEQELKEEAKTAAINVGPDFGTIDEQKKAKEIKQKSVQSGIIIKSCLKNIANEDLEKARAWIAEFEKGLVGG